MNTNQIRLISAGLFFLFIYLSGFWLSRYEKPYPGLFFNLHKLIGLAALVYLGVTVYRIHQAAPLGTLEIAAVAVTAVLFVISIVAGGLLNVNTPIQALLMGIHKISPHLTTLSTAGTLYLLFIAA